jgi:hypothetical protein
MVPISLAAALALMYFYISTFQSIIIIIIILLPCCRVKGKAIPLQTLTGPEGSRRLRLPDFKTIGTWRWQGCQPYVPSVFTPKEISLVLISVRG